MLLGFIKVSGDRWSGSVPAFCSWSRSEFGVDARINNKVCHVDVLWPKLSGH